MRALRVLVIDNDALIVEAMLSLLTNLDHHATGAALRLQHPGLPAALVTAQSSPDLVRQAGTMSVPVIAKPAASADITGFLAQATGATQSAG
jgi:hypothetical protein